MNKFKLITVLLLITFLSLFVIGCTEDDETNEPPRITYFSVDGVIIGGTVAGGDHEAGATVSFSMDVVEGDNNLQDQIRVEIETSTETKTEVKDLNDNLEFTYNYTIAANATGNITLEFSASDDEGQESSRKYTITVIPADANPPTISMFKVNGVDTDGTVGAHEEGSTVSFMLEVDDEALASYTIMEEEAILATGDLTGTSDQITYDYIITELEGNSIPLTFMVTDASENTIERKYTINVVPPYYVYSSVTLGSYDNTTIGSCFAAIGDNGQVVKVLNVTPGANDADIDFVYFWGSTNAATLCAPDYSNVTAIYPSIGNWTIKNGTRMHLANGVDFDNVTDLESAYNSTNAMPSANQLQTTNILAFLTARGQYGLLRVTAIQTGAAGTLTFEAKVQRDALPALAGK